MITMKKLILAITMKRSFTVGLWLMLLAAMPVQAQMESNKLQYMCEDIGSTDWAMCAGYFAGMQNIGAVWSGYAEIGGSKGPYCVSANVTPDIHLRVWQKYVEENPEELAKPAVVTYIGAMQDAFPCE